MRNIIVGTAGHIDHGKTALVRALTGIDTDRLDEEKRRGISIDLGFAHMDLPPDLHIGFVDVPGHERFVKNMLAGIGGIDLVLFVIAADESIKPQTREHFDICRLLGIPRGVVVLTKSDLVDRDILDIVHLEVEEFVAGSFLEGMPIVAVSSTTGDSLDQLRARLAEIAAAAPPKDAGRHFRLPVDRAFSMRGFGAVVTGTLISGSVAREQEVELYPIGRRCRVRGVQVHGGQVERAIAGQRTALNLSGVEPSEVTRGMVLSEPSRFQPGAVIDCRFELLPSAKALKHRAPVHFHAGTAEIEAEFRLLDGSTALQPGGRTFARIVLRDPVLLLPGDRFIVRMFSPVVTIGGGVVVDTGARPYRRHEDAAARLRVLAEGTPAERIALLVRESRFGVGLAELIARTGLLAEEVDAAVRSANFIRLDQPDPWLVDSEWFQQATARIQSVLSEHHRANPLLPGLPRHELRSRELPDAPLFLLEALLAASPLVVAEGEVVRLKSHRLVLKQDEEQAVKAIESLFAEAGLTVPPVNEVLAKSGVEAGRARSLLQILLRQKRLVRVGDELVFHADALRSLREQLAARRGQRFTVPVFKEWTGISRKYAIPLLEYLDRERVTRREGDERIVL
ncbi:MAG TPA: selenocysteine-specific translation elongation factor [Bryobacteraceae bacterium]|nr:selenocysteine-specific translation elongation factor [Bryobacteraceae bacterium]